LVALEVGIDFVQIYLKSALFKLASDSTYWDTQMENKRIYILIWLPCNCRHTNHMYVQEVLDDDDDDDDDEQEFFFPSSAS
jgi:hypothetical protein